MSSEDQITEMLSTMIDGELSREDTLIFLDLLKRNTALQSIWRNYCFVQFFLSEQAAGETRGKAASYSLLAQADLLADRVSAALVNEPVSGLIENFQAPPTRLHALTEPLAKKSGAFIVSPALRRTGGQEKLI